jgi:hypothetical protein
MLTPPWYLILPAHLSKVRVALHNTLYVLHVVIMILYNTLLISQTDNYQVSIHDAKNVVQENSTTSVLAFFNQEYLSKEL